MTATLAFAAVPATAASETVALAPPIVGYDRAVAFATVTVVVVATEVLVGAGVAVGALVGGTGSCVPLVPLQVGTVVTARGQQRGKDVDYPWWTT